MAWVFCARDAAKRSRNYVHGVGIDLGEDEREGIVGGRPHGGIEVGGNEALVGEARRTLALGQPAVAIAPLLADPRLVHEPDLDILSRLLGPHRVALRSEVFYPICAARSSNSRFAPLD